MVLIYITRDINLDPLARLGSVKIFHWHLKFKTSFCILKRYSFNICHVPENTVGSRAVTLIPVYKSRWSVKPFKSTCLGLGLSRFWTSRSEWGSQEILTEAWVERQRGTGQRSYSERALNLKGRRAQRQKSHKATRTILMRYELRAVWTQNTEPLTLLQGRSDSLDPVPDY